MLVDIEITDENDNPPVFIGGPYATTINEVSDLNVLLSIAVILNSLGNEKLIVCSSFFSDTIYIHRD